MHKPYQVPTHCVLVTSVFDVSSDDHGVCNYCTKLLTRPEYILNKPNSR